MPPEPKELIEAKREEIIARWVERMTNLSDVRPLSRDELVDTLPDFLDAIAADVAASDDPSPDTLPPSIANISEQHAQTRSDGGLPLGVVLREYVMLGDVAFDVLADVLPVRTLGMVLQRIRLGALRATAIFSRAREEALRDSEERFRLLVECVRDYGVFMISLDGKVSGWNQGAERLKGYKAEEIIGAPIAVFFPPEENGEEVPARLLARAAAEGSADYEGFLVRKDGTRFWSSLNIAAVRDAAGNLRGYSNVVRDETQRKRAAQLLSILSEAGQTLAGSLDYDRTLHAVVRLAAKKLGDWAVIHLLGGNRLHPATYAHSDEEKDDLLRRALQPISDVTTPTPFQGIATALRTAHTQMSTDTSEAAWVRAAFGIVSPQLLRDIGVRSFVAVPLTARGETFGVLTVVSSRPGRSYGANEVRFAEELASRAALAIDNARLFKEASDAIRARDEFISMASHDLRGPLSTLRLQLQTMLGEANRRPEHTLSNEELVKKLSVLNRQADRLLYMMDSLLDVSRMAAGRVSMRERRCDLRSVAQESTARLGEEMGRAGGELHFHGDVPVEGLWDPDRLDQVITNLVTNAIKYGRGHPIEIFVEAQGASARLTVRDHGPGISKEDQASLFQRFERARATDRIGGFGVGLWIVRRIVDAHGGSVRVESTAGEGATFVVDLPRLLPSRVGGEPPSRSIH